MSSHPDPALTFGASVWDFKQFSCSASLWPVPEELFRRNVDICEKTDAPCPQGCFGLCVIPSLSLTRAMATVVI